MTINKDFEGALAGIGIILVFLSLVIGTFYAFITGNVYIGILFVCMIGFLSFFLALCLRINREKKKEKE